MLLPAASIAWLAALTVAESAAQPTTDVARFSFRQTGTDKQIKHFIFEVRGKPAIDEMRTILADPSSTKRNVSGVIDQSPAVYNPQWHFI
ncbi:hypothetical protein J6524_09990 [Bradyrhizobium sp. WSM 1738]|uniref:BP74-related protein n=1 Tax=Bradyrhizobium hereditatis TaxID=2821405 RepID=UPI001CE3594F|nr:hypothetical protein [Bradyrhizobium hereditatis]MCA6115226.1 hypothetical protein [Bradyrhizobium hereditatis]